jgi:hypothetical protein
VRERCLRTAEVQSEKAGGGIPRSGSQLSARPIPPLLWNLENFAPSGRQLEPDAQATTFAIGEHDVAAVLPRDRTGDGEAEPDAARIRVS